MLLAHRKILDAGRAYIVKDLRVNDVFSELRSKFVLTQEDTERILNETTSREQADKLLDILLDKGGNAFECFRESLSEKYSHLAQLLTEKSTTLTGINEFQGHGPMTQYHRHLLTANRVPLVENLMVDDVLPYLIGKLIFDFDDSQLIHAERNYKLMAEKMLDLLPQRGEDAFGHFVDALRDKYPYLVELFYQDSQENATGISSTAASVERESTKLSAVISKEHNQWIILGEIVRLVRKPVVTYVTKIIETWHEQLLRENSIQIGTCTNRESCGKQKRVQDLCHSCSGWYYKLAVNHRNDNESRIKWRKNCDTSRWSVDAWEVAKFFMPSLGDSKSKVKDAGSTDLSSLLHVLEWMKDAAYGENERIAVPHVVKLRSEVRNVWAHSANQEVTEDQLKGAVKVADEFLDALNAAFVHEDVANSRRDIQFLCDNGLTNVIETELEALLALRRELSEDMSQINEDAIEVGTQSSCETNMSKNQKEVEYLKDQIKLITSQINKLRMGFKRTNDLKAGNAKLKSCLPEKLSTFIGREQEVNRAISHLLENSLGIVSIVGGPGFGKSRTAVEIAHHLDNHHILVFFAYLTGASTVSEVIVRVCRAMGVHPLRDPKSSLIFCLKEIEKCVLVMDNIEQLLEEKTQDEFIDLLRLLRMHSDQRLQILLTSTSKFCVADLGCKTIPLKQLDRSSSKQLVRMCYSEKELDDQYVDKLARLCGDVPLALRIAAFRLQDVHDPDQLLTWLREDPLEILKSPVEKVEKSIEMSFNRLTEQEKKSFVRLSVFDGNYGLEAAQEVTGLEGAQLQNFLTNLVNRSLMERSCNRYSVHPLIRSFLIKCKNNDEFASERRLSQEKMVKCFLKICHDLTLMYWSEGGCSEARRLLKDDAHNVEKTLKLCQESVMKKANQEIVQCLRKSEIYRSLSRFFYHFVLHVLSQSVLSSFLEACAELAEHHEDAAVEVLVKCLTAHIVGRTCGWKSEEYAESMKCAERKFLKNKNVLEEKSRKLEVYSYYYYNLYTSDKESPASDQIFDQAEEYLRSYLELKKNQELNHFEEVDIAITFLLLGRIHRSPEKETTAAKYYEKALKIFEKLLGDHDLKLCCHKELGDSHFEQGNHEKAVVFYEDAMAIHRNLGVSNANISSVYLLKNYGLSLSHINRMEEAIEHLREARNVVQKLFKEHHRCKAEVYCGLAETLDKHQSGCEEAVECANLALGLNRRLSKDINSHEKLRMIIAKANGKQPE